MFLRYSCLTLIGGLLVIACGSKKSVTLFERVLPEKSGITFSNTITENDSINILDYEYVYNGGGLGIGDFNNDGLLDVYIAGNMVNNALYLNMGAFTFNDVAKTAGVEGQGKWCTGISVVDINGDGWQDIYVCASRSSDPEKRKNMLYINQGLDKNGIPFFKDEAEKYGLADTSYSTQAVFFDYDNDGDLDMYLLTAHKIPKGMYSNQYKPKPLKANPTNTDKLYRNEMKKNDAVPHFADVSDKAGINIEGYGLGVNVADINQDGWKDIFVSNDYLTNDLCWINNGDGTFTDKAAFYFKHTSYSAMGNDIADINNDGLADIIELDMNPEDNYRKKMMLNPNNYQNNQFFDNYKYQYQYGRNTLQLNRGRRMLQQDSIGEPVFSEIGYLSGLAETDWSWTPLVADFDNDGWRDIIIMNGFRKDISDHDFIAYRDRSSSLVTKQFLLDQIPEVKIPNYAFHNNQDLTFTNVTKQWGLDIPSYSNGATYADFDNDGDMDCIISNINDPVSLYRNTLNDIPDRGYHYLQLKFQGSYPNVSGLGALVYVYCKNMVQLYEHSNTRGYLSTVSPVAHFGLGKNDIVDSVIVIWPDKKRENLYKIPVDTVLTVRQNSATDYYDFTIPAIAKDVLFTDVTNNLALNITHREKDFIDFNIQKLLLHKLSEYGPALAVGDLNGDKLDDIVMGGSSGFNTNILLQQANGSFAKTDLQGKNEEPKFSEDMGILIFDADNDGDNDIYVTAGGYEFSAKDNTCRDKIWVNNGNATFLPDDLALPVTIVSKSCVRAADFDHDGKPDLFVGGRVLPGEYPKPVSSFIFRNVSSNGKIRFEDITEKVAKDLINLGMVTDAICTDFDNDGWVDIILVGEWMPITILKNEKGVFKNVTAASGLLNKKGWWTSIASADFDNDGYTDYAVGNLGTNSFYKASEREPVSVYANDFDKNGSFDALFSLYLPDFNKNSVRKEFSAHTRDDMMRQMIEIKAKFPNYNSFAKAGFDKILSEDQRKTALILQANTLANCFLHNKGNGTFELIPLLIEAQFSCLNGMVTDDFDGDGNIDIVINGNDFGTEASVGRYDAGNGLFLKGNGKGSFYALPISRSGILIPGNGRALVKLLNKNADCIVLASQNGEQLKAFYSNHPARCIVVNDNDRYALVTLKNGKQRKEEFYYGNSFLSQSSRFIRISDNIDLVEVINDKVEKRVLFRR